MTLASLLQKLIKAFTASVVLPTSKKVTKPKATNVSDPSNVSGPSMGLSRNGIDMIKDSEQLRLNAYLPTPNDVWTIGWGHTKSTKRGMVITEERAEVLLWSDLSWVGRVIDKHVKVPLTQNQYDALYSFIFNLGETNFSTSTLLRLLNKGDYQGAADQLPRWNKQKGNVLRGLTKRRAEERKLFLTK